MPPTPLTDYLGTVARQPGFDPATPRLGTAGAQHLGQHPEQFAVIRDLSADDGVKFTEAVSALGKFGAARQVIQIALRNAPEFRGALAAAEREYATNTSLDWSRVNELVIGLNQRLLNFLSAMRTFLDHAETRIKRKHGKQSQEAKDFAAATAAEFDGHFAYRFMYKLRNYTQHCGMPLGHIAANSALPTPRPDEQPFHRIDFFFDRDVLLNNFDEWGAIVEPELRAMPQLFPLSAYIDQTVGSLKRIDAAVTRIDRKDLAVPLQFLRGLLDEVGPTQGIPCVYSRLEFLAGDPPKANVQFNRFPLDAIDILTSA